MTFGNVSPWSEQAIADLVRLYAEGLSCRAIGEQIGLSRNAVIGKVHRLGLQPPATKKPVVRAGKEIRPRIKRSTVTHQYTFSRLLRVDNFHDTGPAIRVTETSEIKLRCVEIVPLNLTLADLPYNGCRYIAGDDLLYCGHSVKDGSSYCVPHHHLVWTAPRVPIARFAGRSAA